MPPIVGLATPRGRAALGVVRVSGDGARALVEGVCPGGPAWRPRRASVRPIVLGQGVVDRGVVVWMPAPRSATGEEVVEIALHGNPLVCDAVVEALVERGGTLAGPGAFTRQAVLNGRMTLAQAEAVAALVEARTIEGARLAQDALDAGFSRLLEPWREALLDIAAELEARLDHPEEDLSFESDDVVARRLHVIEAAAMDLASTWSVARRRIEGVTVALVGPVNAGKSSLFNALVGTRRALVSDRPGTTRDVVETAFRLGSHDVHILDTAGEGGTSDPLEREGLEIGRAMSRQADLRLVVFPLQADAIVVRQFVDTVAEPRVLVATHMDLGSAGFEPEVAVDCIGGAGLPDLRAHLVTVLDLLGDSSRQGLVSARQHDLVSRISRHARDAAQALEGPLGPAVAAQEVALALETLAELDGRDVREEVLDRVFARFCIGK